MTTHDTLRCQATAEAAAKLAHLPSDEQQQAGAALYRLPDGSADWPDINGQHTKQVNVLHSAAQARRFTGCPACQAIARSEDPARQAAVAAATARITPVVGRAEITESPAEPGPCGMPAHLTVRTIWAGDGLDRTDGTGWAVKDRRMAERLAAAITAGAAVTAAGVGIDTNGRTYVIERSRILARTMNADLRRLGF